ncbi:response regulator transcription factor [Larkinella rosea]|uniref:Response regulator n=1 Tax=Larkinella rosea TaxID=2025312 RepID=A0A3P1BP25_9BACT|nr:response regulator [Larkinella rosea]RRB02847.1 response regulator [Larkinella rosea]
MADELTDLFSSQALEWLTNLTLGVLLGGLLFGLFIYGPKWFRAQKLARLAARQAKQQQTIHDLKVSIFHGLTMEFRTTLTLILLPIQHMLMETQEAKNRHRLATIEKNAYRLLSLFNQQMDPNNPDDRFLKTPDLLEKPPVDLIRFHPEKPAPLPNAQPLILLVENNPELADSIASGFTGKYTVLQVTNGLEGWEQATGLIPDLIIGDIEIPDMDGFTLCRKLKEDQRTQHIPVVLLTTTPSTENRIKGLALGADDYFSQPYNFTEFQLRIQNLMDHQRRLREWMQATIFRPF